VGVRVAGCQLDRPLRHVAPARVGYELLLVGPGLHVPDREVDARQRQQGGEGRRLPKVGLEEVARAVEIAEIQVVAGVEGERLVHRRPRPADGRDQEQEGKGETSHP